MARVCCRGKSALRRVQTINDTCVGVENKLRWVQDRAHHVMGETGVRVILLEECSADIGVQTQNRLHLAECRLLLTSLLLPHMADTAVGV